MLHLKRLTMPLFPCNEVRGYPCLWHQFIINMGKPSLKGLSFISMFFYITSWMPMPSALYHTLNLEYLQLSSQETWFKLGPLLSHCFFFFFSRSLFLYIDRMTSSYDNFSDMVVNLRMANVGYPTWTIWGIQLHV